MLSGKLHILKWLDIKLKHGHFPYTDGVQRWCSKAPFIVYIPSLGTKSEVAQEFMAIVTAMDPI